ncbi:MAG: hypothetical protein LBN96_08990 [Desulfovibrio sp.]|nr:hypothetical protein [Desulfovibrio sp.]
MSVVDKPVIVDVTSHVAPVTLTSTQACGENDETALSPEGNRAALKWKNRAVPGERRVIRRC